MRVDRADRADDVADDAVPARTEQHSAISTELPPSSPPLTQTPSGSSSPAPTEGGGRESKAVRFKRIQNLSEYIQGIVRARKAKVQAIKERTRSRAYSRSLRVVAFKRARAGGSSKCKAKADSSPKLPDLRTDASSPPSARSCVLTFYLTDGVDPQRHHSITDLFGTPDNALRAWLASLRNVAPDVTVVFDESETMAKAGFCGKGRVSCETIPAQDEAWARKASLNDRRFYMLQRWLRSDRARSYDYVFMTDGTDVEVHCDPSEFMRRFGPPHPQLAVGDDDAGPIARSHFMRNLVKKCGGDGGLIGNSEEIRTACAGVSGGERAHYVALIDRLVASLDTMDDSVNCNMLAFNVAVSAAAGSGVGVHAGIPFTSPFRCFDNSAGFCLRHK